MAGTKAGGLAAAKRNKEKYGPDFYKNIGKMGGSAEKTRPSGFAAMSPEKRSAAGRKGGSTSRRPKPHA